MSVVASAVAAFLLTLCPVPPVEAPVVDPFRPPLCPWCPGNRGLEYGVSTGAPVRAVMPGQVTFAGVVAGHQFVTVRISDGRRLTYGRLSEIVVRVGQQVAVGQRLGRTGDTFILTLRRGDDYEDPAPLVDGWERIRLVRIDGRHRPPSTPRCGTHRRWGSPLPLR